MGEETIPEAENFKLRSEEERILILSGWEGIFDGSFETSGFLLDGGFTLAR